jgi:hypothetical protein
MEEGEESSFYLLRGTALVVLLCELWDVYVYSVFPCIVTFGLSFPLDEVLKAF